MGSHFTCSNTEEIIFIRFRMCVRSQTYDNLIRTKSINLCGSQGNTSEVNSAAERALWFKPFDLSVY